MAIGYVIAGIVTFLGAKELQIEFGMFKTPTQEMREEVKEETRQYMMRDAIKEVVRQMAEEELAKQKEANKTYEVPEESIPKGVITHEPTLKELASD